MQLNDKDMKKLKLVVVLLCTASIFMLLVYPLLHESGHLLAAKVFGSKHSSIKLGIIQAWASFDGIFTQQQFSMIHIAGMVFTLLMWLIFIMLIPKESPWWFEPFKLVFSASVIGSLLVWVIVPVLYVYGKAPMGEDATKFTISTSWNGYAIGAVGLIVFVVSLILFIRKNNFRKIFILGEYWANSNKIKWEQKPFDISKKFSKFDY